MACQVVSVPDVVAGNIPLVMAEIGLDSRRNGVEAQAAANLNHPALPRVSDHFSDADGQFLVMDFIEGIEHALGKVAQKNFLPLQDGDVPATSADVSELEAWTDFRPRTPVRDGVGRFVQWYRDYYKI